MNPKLPDLNLYLDVSGRFSKQDTFPLAIAGVALESHKVDEIRDALLTVIGSVDFKWSKAYQDIPKAKKTFRLMVKRQLTGYVALIRKTQPKWNKYWNHGERLYQTGVLKAQEAIPYARPSMTLKFHLYSLSIANLWAFHIQPYKEKLLAHKGAPFKLKINAICDTDIQGEQSQRIFKEIHENLGDLPNTRKQLNLIPSVNVSLRTEEEEPLLLLPDFVAGYVYSGAVYGDGRDNERQELLKMIAGIYSKWPYYALKNSEIDFDLIFLLSEDTFDYVMPRRERERLRAFISEGIDSDPG